MTRLLKISALLLLIGLSFLISCKRELACRTCSDEKTNQPPVANAGPDVVIILPKDSVLLDGRSSSDPDGRITNYSWSKISGPSSLSILHSADSMTIVKSLVAGSYLFELKVTDNGGLSAKDTITVTVDSTNNHPPIAKAGADQTISLPNNSVTVDGSASTDPENNIISYAWTKISGPATFNIVNANAVQTQLTNLIQGIYQIELKVTDAGGLFSKDTMNLQVNSTIVTTCSFQTTLVGTINSDHDPFQIAIAGNKIVFAGGYEAGNINKPFTKVDIFDLATQTWSSVEINHGGYVATIVAGDKIFFAGGGTSANRPSSRVDIYNTTDNTWTNTELTAARSATRAIRAGNKILFAGGDQSTKVEIYDLSSSSWSVVDINHSIYGASSLGNKAILEAYTLFDIYDASDNSWSTYPIGGFYYNMSRATLGNKIYLAGGYNGGYGGNNFSNLVHEYDVITNSWSSFTLSQPKAGMTGIAAGNKVFWGGGFDSIWHNGSEDAISTVDEIEVYDVVTKVHSHHEMEPGSIGYTGYGVANNYVLFRSSTNALHIFNLNSEIWSICSTALSPNLQTISFGNAIYFVGRVSGKLTIWKMEF